MNKDGLEFLTRTLNKQELIQLKLIVDSLLGDMQYENKKLTSGFWYEVPETNGNYFISSEFRVKSTYNKDDFILLKATKNSKVKIYYSEGNFKEYIVKDLFSIAEKNYLEKNHIDKDLADLFDWDK